MFRIIYLSYILIIFSCSYQVKNKESKVSSWQFVSELGLDSISPIGIGIDSSFNFWLSDAEMNRIIQLNSEGSILQTYEEIERPMHIQIKGQTILVAEYGADQIRLIHHGRNDIMDTEAAEFDAPSGIDEYQGTIYVADFYNHRVVKLSSDSQLVIGQQGKGPAEFNYPTDVQIANNRLYVADAYNHRIQVFDLSGNHLQTIGENEKMNAVTGIFVNFENIFVTDFENSRVLIYDLDGILIQILESNLNKPTDLIELDNTLYVVNYKGKSITKFQFL